MNYMKSSKEEKMVESYQTIYKKNANPNSEIQHTSSEPRPLFASKKELFVASGDHINVYNPFGGHLIEVLKGHEYKVVSICKVENSEYEIIISCDEKANLFYWYSDRNHPKNATSLSLSFGEDSLITHFSISGKTFILTFLTSERQMAKLCLVRPPYKKAKYIITKDVLLGQNKIAVGCEGKYLVALKNKELSIMELTFYGKISRMRYHKTGYYSISCVVLHPSKDLMATGNDNGAIMLWFHILERAPVKVVLHWHTMPVRDLCFSSTGSDLYSGGDECVMVRWHLSDDNKKSFLPRLGMPIRFVQGDPTNSFLALLHNDESLSIVNIREMRLEGLIQKMTSHVPLTTDGPLSIGLLYHPPTDTLIKNGRTGHLQFFKPQLLKLVYNLDITMSNFVTQERHQKLPNVDVTMAALSNDGLWLVTSEVCQLTPTIKEIVMKFWHFSLQKQGWELNTSVQMPHSDTVNCISMKLMEESSGEPVCVSCSEEGRMKIWKLITYEDVFGKKRSHWNSRASRQFRGLAATACAFAADGSLFAVAFESVLTLWTPENAFLVGSLSQSFFTERIVDVTFSHGDWEGPALVSRSKNYLCSWDLLSCTLLWRVLLRSTCLAVDQTSGLMALFSKEKVFFFDPCSSKPISTFEKGNETEVVCAAFVPCNEAKKNRKRKRSSSRNRLYYFDAKQNYYSLDDPYSCDGKDSSEQERPTASHENVPLKEDVGQKSDLFSALVAKSRNITQSKEEEEELETEISLTAPSVNRLMKDLNDLHIHSLSFLGLLEHVESFLPNLSIKNGPKEEQQQQQQQKNMPKYATFEEESRRSKTLTRAPYSEEETAVKAIQKLDFSQVVHKLQS